MLLEDLSSRQIVVIYPGRFSPFHKGHKAVYDYLNKRFDNVFVATSDKVAPPRSPFNFEEKKKMMELTGMDTSRVVQTKNPYQAMEIVQNFDKANTVLLFAVSEKDMAEDPRFSFKPKKNGDPSYFQAAPKDLSKAETMDKHGYIMTVPTFKFDVMGAPMKSATEVRSTFAKMNNKNKKKLITDLFGNYNDEVMSLMSNKITESHFIDPEQMNRFDRVGYNHDQHRIFRGIDQDLKLTIQTLKNLLHKIQNLEPGTKVRQRFLIQFHSVIALVKQQMAQTVVAENKKRKK